jgi:glutamate dehydrogenase
VPVGSKGGFILKCPPEKREDLAAEVELQYRELISGLLDLTDNRVGKEVVHPPDTVVYDKPDPYLVVAADKGTAAFSDVGNELAAAYGFWLDDAFASGGSQGYDHKKYGITARGAWECVRHHFLELGLHVDRDLFTVVGIGDMSGDVFGNGLLLSRKAKLVAAFDHRHIFVDPDPDPETTFAERRRLFEKPRSSWDDFDRGVLSEGGGVFARSAKRITFSTQIRHLLEIEQESLSGEELIQAILRLPVGLLYNGGIGTYVKARHESHEDAHDERNDPVRVSADELRCRVVAEGGNLGLTPAAAAV